MVTPAHFYRDLNPCIYCRGNLFIAPTDSPDIFSLDAATGQLLWECRHFPETIHLLGVGGNNLIASGKQICWLDIDSGKVEGCMAGNYFRFALRREPTTDSGDACVHEELRAALSSGTGLADVFKRLAQHPSFRRRKVGTP